MKQNLKIIRGDDTTLTVRVRQNDAPLDITKADLHAKVKGKLVLALSSDDGTIEIGERLLLHFTHALTDGAKWASADYDLQVISNGKVKTVMYGRLDMQHDITN